MEGKDSKESIAAKSICLKNCQFEYFAGMFTGIIESQGLVEAVFTEGTNRVFWISSPISGELKVDQSLSHNGVCLTVDQLETGRHRVTAIAETLSKTNLGQLEPGHLVNLERCMQMNGRLDGHIVQGHVDSTGIIRKIEQKDGSWLIAVEFNSSFAPLLIEKGSICLNGISLTVFDVGIDRFHVAIIPYTYEHTNINRLKPGDTVNLEFDVLGKYIQRSLALHLTNPS